MLENLNPAPKITAPKEFRPGVEFDGTEGTATTDGLLEQPNFDEFLSDRGFNPDEYEIVGAPRTSQWQRYDGEWLTAYRFRFQKRVISNTDLPLLYSQAKKEVKPTKPKTTNCTLVIGWSDTQTGKVGSRGGTEELIQRIEAKRHAVEAFIKQHKPEQVLFLDVGDGIEGFENTGGQLFTNDLSIMQQVDLEATFRWEMLKMLTRHTNKVIAASIGSNHCQWRKGKDRLGNPLDDWGIHINRQLARLSQEVGLPIQFLEPQPYDESLAIEVYEHIIGLAHGHQANRPDRYGVSSG